jgi:DNA primase
MTKPGFSLADAKTLYPLSRYMLEHGLSEHARKSARCPFHKDSNRSFSVYVDHTGEEKWKCFAGCGQGDVIAFLGKHKNLSNSDACREFIRLAREYTHAYAKR